MKIFSECTETMMHYVRQLSEPERNELQEQWEKEFAGKDVLRHLKWVLKQNSNT